MKAGIKIADLFVGELEEAAMIRVYARENATQRGNSSTAVAGTVASAVRFLGKLFLTQEVSVITDTLGWSQQEAVQAKAAVGKDEGVGARSIGHFLENVPGMDRKETITQQLANLKASGDYARIITEVKDEIEQEHREALKALAHRARAAEDREGGTATRPTSRRRRRRPSEGWAA